MSLGSSLPGAGRAGPGAHVPTLVRGQNRGVTLVVARVTPIGVRLAGDMRITDPNATRSGFFEAQLKVILLRPTLCVAYAGNVGAALNAIREVASQALDPAAAERRLFEAHLDSQPKVDFIVASLKPSRLLVIKNNEASEMRAGWLGDAGAFADYQRIYHDPANIQPPRELYDSEDRYRDLEIASRLAAGIQAVVFGVGYHTEGGEPVVRIPEGGKHPGVGETVITAQPLIAHDDLFGYSTMSRMIAPPFAEAPPGHSGVYDPGFGSAERGSFSYAVMTPVQPGVGAVGIYFPEGRVGLLYAPLIHDEPERYTRVSQDQFAELLRLRHGISLEGFGLGITFE
jgi:hypothetical protein